MENFKLNFNLNEIGMIFKMIDVHGEHYVKFLNDKKIKSKARRFFEEKLDKCERFLNCAHETDFYDDSLDEETVDFLLEQLVTQRDAETMFIKSRKNRKRYIDLSEAQGTINLIDSCVLKLVNNYDLVDKL